MLAASETVLARTIGRSAARHLALVRALLEETLRREMAEAIRFPSSRELVDYLHLGMAFLPAEHFRVLFLAADHGLLADEVVNQGTVSEVQMYPREVVRRALELAASELVLVHNHPSGNPEPSASDIAATRLVADAARTVGITVLDHIVVGRGGWTSLRELGLV